MTKISLTAFGTILSIGAIAPLALQNAPLRRILPLSPLGGLPTIPQTPSCCIGISSLKFRYNKIQKPNKIQILMTNIQTDNSI